MYTFIIDHSHKDAFLEASRLEDAFPNGEWRYFNFNGSKCEGLYQVDTDVSSEFKASGFSNNTAFFNTFLGLFSPSLKEFFLVENFLDFKSFCLSLNTYLNDGVEIFDLSRKGLWIWSDKDSDKKTSAPKKLLSYLNQ